MEEDNSEYLASGKAFMLTSYEFHKRKIPRKQFYEEFLKIYLDLKTDAYDISFNRLREKLGFSLNAPLDSGEPLHSTKNPLLLAVEFMHRLESSYVDLGKIVEETFHGSGDLDAMNHRLRTEIFLESL